MKKKTTRQEFAVLDLRHEMACEAAAPLNGLERIKPTALGLTDDQAKELTPEGYAVLDLLHGIAREIAAPLNDLQRIKSSGLGLTDNQAKEFEERLSKLSIKFQVLAKMVNDRHRMREARKLGAETTAAKRRSEVATRVAHLEALIKSGVPKTAAVESTAAEFKVETGTIWRNLREANKR